MRKKQNKKQNKTKKETEAELLQSWFSLRSIIVANYGSIEGILYLRQIFSHLGLTMSRGYRSRNLG